MIPLALGLDLLCMTLEYLVRTWVWQGTMARSWQDEMKKNARHLTSRLSKPRIPRLGRLAVSFLPIYEDPHTPGAACQDEINRKYDVKYLV